MKCIWYTLRFVSKDIRHFSRCSILRQNVEPLTVPVPDGQSSIFSDKINKLVTEISHLNLLEVSDLSKALKQRLNLPDAPVMAMSALPSKAAVEEEEIVPKEVQTSFTLKLMKFEEKQKVALIKEVKNLLEGMNLVQAKKFVESAPTVVKSDISKEEAEKLKEALSKVGAELEIV
uniref:39S ribosomal protein L12, mitochondrial n=1 Tax=Clastoptera arizonana TaxID=38151 RepID=A0A1B6CTE9_9HEMI